MKNCLKCGKELSKRQAYYCSNECKLTHREGIEKRTGKRPKQEPNKRAVCRIDGKSFRDFNNYSGALSKHLRSLEITEFSDVFEHFDVVEEAPTTEERWHCKYCNWSTKDSKNKSGCITNHIKSHKITIQDHMDDHPEDKGLWIYSPTKEVKDYILLKDSDSYIECRECGEKFKRLTKTHLKFHGLTLKQYRAKHQIENLTSKTTIQKFRDSYKKHTNKINRVKKVSKIELELGEWLRSLGEEVEYSNRKVIAPYELDVFLRAHNLAIEVNGLYWHSEAHGKKHKNYHLSKLEMCEKAGVSLVQIFDDEWKDKQEIIKSKILSKIGRSKTRIYARNCSVKEIGDKKIKSQFLKANHVQSDDRSKVALGLYHKDELVAVMTFGPLRRALGQSKKDGHYELVRYCTSDCVVGGASKLFKHFLALYSPDSVVSYADRRYSSSVKSTLYDSLGFKLVGSTPPNYWYTKDFRKKLHRYNFTKSRLVKEFGADPSNTEFRIMSELGYDRVWDCGSLKYVYPKSKN